MKNRVRFVFLVLSAIALQLSGCGKSDSSTTATLRNSYFADAQGGCPNGGFKVEVLVNGEVDASQTVYTCNGSNPEAGTHSNIQVTIFDGAQRFCSNGGSKVEVFEDGVVDERQTQVICNGAGGHGASQDGRYALVSTSEDVGANCAHGGIRIDTGLDANGNGSLDADEIRSARYICHGADGSDGTDGKYTAIQTTLFEGSQDEHCTNGGIKLEVLLDGAVQEGQTQYVCNGANGRDAEDGHDGHHALVNTTEDVGTNCANGGIRIDTGLDANGNGSLDADEILGTRYICHGADGENGAAGKHPTVQATSFDGAQDPCSNGGIKVELLLDGAVQEGQTQFICNGANGRDGANGQDGHRAIVDTSDEVGSECAHGGIRVDVGMDTDDDGELGGNEVLYTKYVCHGANGADGADGKYATVQTETFDGEQAGHCSTGGIKLEVLFDGVAQGEAQYICNGVDGHDGESGHNGVVGHDGRLALVNTSDEVGTNCAHGGIRVQVGLDANGDGVLDADEILHTDYVCHGAPGAAGSDGTHVTVRATTFEGEQDGHCANGGTKLEVLLDGAVQEGQTQYICNGANGNDGADGHDGHRALVNTSEDVGTNCEHGGIRVDSGVDANDNGTLDGDEIHTDYICHGAAGVDGAAGNYATVQTETFDGDLDGNCAHGGIKIEVLLDGVVQGQAQYICNGANGNDGADGQNGHRALVVTTDEVGTNCAHGGIRVDSGVDANDDKALDPDEILHSEFVCNGADGDDGAPGKHVTVQTTPFEDSLDGHCANGGIKLEVLLDGVAQDGQTQYICNGTNGHDGADGIDGHHAIVDTSDEAGSECAHGGIRVDVGMDIDDDGELDGDEVLYTGFVCHGADGANGAAGNHATVQTTPFDGALDGHCTNGGIKLEVLLDGVVQGQAQYICHGTDGISGSNGDDGLLAYVITSDDVGTNCEYGGIRVDSGLDVNENAELDADEIHTDYICHGAPGVDGANGKYATVQTTSFDVTMDGHCSNGGIKIEVYWDGELQEDQTRYVCNGIPCNVANAVNEYINGECVFTCNPGYMELDGACVPAFITKWDVASNARTVTFPIQGREGTIVIDWGDGTARTIIDSGTDNYVSHTYSSAGEYTIGAMGTLGNWNCLKKIPEYSYRCSSDYNNGQDSLCKQLVEVEYYGDVTFGGCTFYYSKLSHIPEEGTPRFHDNKMNGVFYYATEFNQNIEFWDTSNITSMEVLFSHASKFNQPLNNWDVSSVSAMRSVFYEASSFNQPLDNWDTSNVTDMTMMFWKTTSFNQSLDSWNVSNVTEMTDMFKDSGIQAENYCALFAGAYGAVWTRFKGVLGRTLNCQ